MNITNQGRFQKMLYRAYVPEGYIHRGKSADKIFWTRTVRADKPSDALDKVLPDIIKHVLPYADSDIKYVSVHIGTKKAGHTASRMTPIQITLDGKIRGRK
jgi:hypothetical protein